jgi:hypothetical protein
MEPKTITAKTWSFRMTTELHLIAALSHNLTEPLAVAQKKRCSARSPKLLRWARK